jgi:hypothetical protein
VVGQLQGILLDYLVTNEGPNIVKTETLSISAEKISAKVFGEKESTLKKGRFKPPSAAAFGLGDGKYVVKQAEFPIEADTGRISLPIT